MTGLASSPAPAATTLSEVTPDIQTLDGVLRELVAFVSRYVVLSTDQTIAVALWIIHTHCFEAADCTPYLQISSVTKRSGKTRLLEVLEAVVAKPWLTGRTSAAALCRKIDSERPTLLLDESDAAFRGEKEYAEVLRGTLNSGYRRSGKHTVCMKQGANFIAANFSTFAPKAIAGIGGLPGTIADRSIPIILKRRRADETCDRWRERDGHRAAEPLRTWLANWAHEAIDDLRSARPELPSQLGDRQQDVWEALFAIADAAGENWPATARRAAVVLCGSCGEEDDLNLELLQDIRTVFENEPSEFIRSNELAGRLSRLEGRPWAGTTTGKPITANAIANQLAGFGIFPSHDRSGSTRGYYRDRFEVSVLKS
jgi:hypothetical protein